MANAVGNSLDELPYARAQLASLLGKTVYIAGNDALDLLRRNISFPHIRFFLTSAEWSYKMYIWSFL